jgi:hypothetical protein
LRVGNSRKPREPRVQASLIPGLSVLRHSTTHCAEPWKKPSCAASP